MGAKRNSCTVLGRKPKEKTLVGRHGHRWEDNIKKNLKEMGWEDMD
jgi:hypothetical protein